MACLIGNINVYQISTVCQWLIQSLKQGLPALVYRFDERLSGGSVLLVNLLLFFATGVIVAS